MKILELQKLNVKELSPEELSLLQGGEGIFYYIAYDVGFLLGTTLKVTEKVAESLLYRSVTTNIK